MTDVKEFCVICLSKTLSHALYALVYVPEDHTIDWSDWWLGHHQGLKGGNDNPIHSLIAGRPRALIKLARELGRDSGARFVFDQSYVGIWAETEWFGLRVCPEHLWDAQTFWQAGGNKNWRP